MSHTPGPWNAHYYDFAGSWTVKSATGEYIAFGDGEFLEADAHLIAAAPKLLAAAKAFLAAADNEHIRKAVAGRPEFDTLYRSGADLLDAIAEAEGHA